MEILEFILPMKREELLRQSGPQRYFVEEVIGERSLPGALENFRITMRTEGYLNLSSKFDVPYSVLCSNAVSSKSLRETLWQVLIKACPSMTRGLRQLFESPLPSQARQEHLNVLKMWTYLMCQLTEEFESEENKSALLQGRTKKSNTTTFQIIDWPYEKDVFLRCVQGLVDLDLHKLWSPPILEEDFINLVTSCCYNMLKNPSVSRQKDTRELIANILGLIVKCHHRELGNSLRMLQLLQHHEHTVGPLVNITETMVNKYGANKIVLEIMREVGSLESKDIANDTSGSRSYATFLVDLSARIPQVVFRYISLLMPCRYMDSSTMRNCVLCVIKETLISVLSGENMGNNLKKNRDNFLTILKDHIHDVNAFVRSKVLQVWADIVVARCLPLSHQKELTDRVVGRLMDKSAIVRRYAVQLLTLLLQMNPFTYKLEYEDLKESYDKEKAKLDSMMESRPVEDPKAALNEKWSVHESSIKSVFEESPDVTPEDLDSLLTDDDTADSIVTAIISAVDAKDYLKSRLLLLAANKAWPDLFVLGQQHSESFGIEIDDDEEEREEACEPMVEALKDIYLGNHQMTVITEAAVMAGQNTENGVVNELSKQQVLVLYLKDSATFSGQLKEAIPTLCGMLHSKINSDILEAIEFFVSAYEFGLKTAVVGIRKSLGLMHTARDNVIKDAVVNAYKRIYLKPSNNSDRTRALMVIDSLSKLISDVTLEELMSLETLVANFVKSGDLDNSLIQVMWERFTMKIPNTTPQESRAALNLIMMAAGGDSEIVKSNISVLVSVGLGPQGEKDLRVARDTCSVLLKIGSAKKKPGEVAERPFRLSEDHELFSRLHHLLLSSLFDLDHQFWVPLCDKAVHTTYTLAEGPDHLCGELLKAVARKVLVPTTECNGDNNNDDDDDDTANTPTPITNDNNNSSSSNNSPSTTANPTAPTTATAADTTTAPTTATAADTTTAATTNIRVPAGVLSRLVFLIGCIAHRQLEHLNCNILPELKRRAAVKERNKRSSLGRGGGGSSRGRKDQTMDSTTNVEDESGITGATAEDDEAEYVRQVCELQVLSGDGLLGSVAPLVQSICHQQSKYHNPELQAAASLTLSKMMLISSDFCDKNLQLLFTLLEKSPHPTVRANTIIALSDLTFLFPNLIEPWTAHMYARLRDPSPAVRKNTVCVLSHLILNDMVKVKGQLSEMAICTIDEDPKISELSKAFFVELSGKPNAVYNIIADIISRLSDPELGVDETSFQTILKFLFNFIQKDKQAENLVEKLSQRLRIASTERQWRDLAYCLSLLPFNEKCVCKLQENLDCFADKLTNQVLYDHLMAVLKKARVRCKANYKCVIDETEAKITEFHTKGLDEVMAQTGATGFKTPAKAAPRTKSRPSNAGGRTPRQGKCLPPEVSVTPRRSQRKKDKQAYFSSDSEEEE
ncbi:hypothetical protein Ahia01_000496400 [Argonauta hians]